MKKRFIIAATAAVALVFGTPALASATEVCEPTDAWTETIVISPEIPAVGEPTMTVDHPAETIDHPAETVDHPAVTQTQWKYTKHGGNGFLWLDNNDHKYVDANGNAANWKDWMYFTVYERTSHTQEVTISEAWTETISEAWTETISEAWTETVQNPDYVPAVPAVTKTVEHEAVTCPLPEEEEPEDNVTPEVPEIVVPPSIPDAQAPTEIQEISANTATEEDSLAVTGSNDAVLPIGALALAAMVAGGTMIARRARRG